MRRDEGESKDEGGGIFAKRSEGKDEKGRSQEPETSNPKLKTLTAKLAWRKLRTVTIAHVHPSAQSLTPHLPCLWS